MCRTLKFTFSILSKDGDSTHTYLEGYYIIYIGVLCVHCDTEHVQYDRVPFGH